MLITQNVDGLHVVAGSKNLIEMHGSLHRCFCSSCKKKYDIKNIDLSYDIPKCPACNKFLRPDIVWFGEIPYELNPINEALNKATAFISIGTSGQVYPAAQFITICKYNGIMTIGINLTRPENKHSMDYFYQGKSGELLPELVRDWCSDL